MGSSIQEDPILKQKYPAKAHARKAAEWIKRNGGEGKGVIYLEGQKSKLVEVRAQHSKTESRGLVAHLNTRRTTTRPYRLGSWSA